MSACPHGTRRNFELDGFTWWECPACGEAGELVAPPGTLAGDLAQLGAALTNLKETIVHHFIRVSIPFGRFIRWVLIAPTGGRKAERRHRRRWK